MLLLTFLLFLVFALTRLSIRRKVAKKDLETIDKYRKINIEYKDYEEIFKDNMDPYGAFHLEIKEYQLFLKSVCDSFMRMDKKLNVLDMNSLNMGLDLLKGYSKKNKEIKKDYDITNDAVEVILKYYGKDGKRIDKLTVNKHWTYYLIGLSVVILLVSIIGLFIKRVIIYLILVLLVLFIEILCSYLLKKR